MEENNKGKMGFWSIFLLGITGVVGSGIFLLPSSATKLVGVASIYALIFDALLVIAIAMCFAKASTYFDRDGGPYLYAKDAFGGFVGFEVGFVTWAIRIIAEATIAVSFTTALGTVWPYVNTESGKIVVVTVLVVLLAAMNIAGVGLSKVIINIATVAKLVPLILFIAVGIFFIKGSHFSPVFPASLSTGGAKFSAFGVAAMTLFYAYTGFEGTVVAAGDMKNPKKNLPRALMASIIIVAAIYVFIQVVSIGVLGQTALSASQAPIQEAFTKIAGNFGKSLVLAGTLISIGGLFISSTYITPRSGVALAENKMMPEILARRNKVNAPWVSIIVSEVIVLIIAYSGTFAQLALISSISRFAQYIPTCLAVIVYLRTKKNKESNFHLPLGPVIPVIAIVVSIVLLTQVPLVNIVWGLGALLIAVPFYFITGSYKVKSEK